ncbi:MAG: hypothetical protein K4571_12875 [Deltaproteobacteria bacterium]
MNQATKAAMYSALLIPGWGQFYLKRYKRGLVFLLPVLAGTLILTWMVVRAGANMIKAAPFKKGTIQLSHVMEVVLKTFRTIDLFYFLLMLLLIAVIWILSIVDAYQLGNQITTVPTTGADQESSSDPV